MKHAAAIAAIALCATPASADLETALSGHVVPRVESFAEATGALADAARADCRAVALTPAYHDAFDAWIGISHLRLGPLEENGRSLAIGFWPDSRGIVGRTVSGLLADEDPVVDDPEAFANVSVAARGVFALERLISEPEVSDYGSDAYACRLATAISVDLARMGSEIRDDWQGYVDAMRTAGEEGNEIFLSPREADTALYTALTTGLEFTEDQRLGAPLGSFERPRPARAEARRSGRSLRNVVLSLEVLHDLASALADDPIPDTDAAFTRALDEAERLDDPIFAGVADPGARIRVEALRQRVSEIRAAVAVEIGAALGLSAGFNSQDGD